MADQNDGKIIGFTKPRKFLFFKMKSKPIYASGSQPTAPPAAPAKPSPVTTTSSPTQKKVPSPRPFAIPSSGHGAKGRQAGTEGVKFSRIEIYLDNIVAKHRNLDIQLREQGIKGSPQQFAKRMLMNAVLLAAVIAIALIFGLDRLLSSVNANPAPVAILLGAVCGLASYNILFNQFLGFPANKAKQQGREVERAILFAARDIIISLRSGVPLFNALTSVSTGYGAASLEFGKIINLIQLGMPMDQAIDQVSASSTSRTFKRIMLQASVSIKEGADVVGALQEVVDQAMQERVIELRRYGQRLNALSMFYMLFGVIFPSIGIAVLSILTTFINIFTVTNSLLVLVLVFIALIQFIFFNVMKNSRPLFTM